MYSGSGCVPPTLGSRHKAKATDRTTALSDGNTIRREGYVEHRERGPRNLEPGDSRFRTKVQFSASGQKDRIQAAAVKLSDAPQLLDCLAGGRIKSERS